MNLIEYPDRATLMTTVAQALVADLAAALAATGIVADLRRAGISTDMTYKGNMKRRMQKANDWSARYAIILGDDELARGEAALKNLVTGEQHSVALADIVRAVSK